VRTGTTWGRAAVVLGALAFAIPLSAHHSIAGVYDSTNPVTVEGTVRQFHFVNPHPFITVTVKDAKGSSKDWRMEMDNRWELEAIGMAAGTLNPGDRVVVTGSRGRQQANSLYIRRLDRPADGFWYEQVGTTPRTGSR
jgi:Family of unknown function (DUF6152)